jgi:Flp pilus assembly protein TadG
MPSRCPPERSDAGTVTAELAVVLPAVLLVLAACLGALRVGVEQARLDAAAAVASRSVARGDAVAVATARAVAAGAGSVAFDRPSGLVCARAVAPARILGLAVPVVGTACALAP